MSLCCETQNCPLTFARDYNNFAVARIGLIVKVKVIAEISARIALLWRSWSIALLWPAWLALNDNAQMLTWKTWAAYCLVNFNQVTDLIV